MCFVLSFEMTHRSNSMKRMCRKKRERKVEFIGKHHELNLMMLLWFFYVMGTAPTRTDITQSNTFQSMIAGNFDYGRNSFFLKRSFYVCLESRLPSFATRPRAILDYKLKTSSIFNRSDRCCFIKLITFS